MDLDERANALLEHNRTRWLQNVPSWALDPKWPPGTGSFLHGFLNRVSVTAEQFLESSADLFAVAPILEAQIAAVRDGGTALAGHADLGRLDRADIGFVEEPVNLPAFFASPHIAGLVGLELTFRGPEYPGASWQVAQPMLDDDGARAIASCAGLARLKSLNLSVGMIGSDGLGALAESPYLSALEELNVSAHPVGDEGLVRLARSPLLPRLTDLNLCGTNVGDGGLRALLAAGPHRLRRLHIGRPENCPISDAGMHAFARCEALAGLRELDLSSWPLTPNLVRAVARSPHLAGLTVLKLGSCGIDDEMAAELARSPYLRNLRFLDLQSNQIGADGLTALARSPVLATITCLGIFNNPEIGDAGVLALADSDYVGELRGLGLIWTGLGLAGLRAVATSARFRQLRTLDVQNNHLGDEGGRVLCETPHLARLILLTVFDCGFSEDMKAALRARFGAALRI